MNTLPEKYKPLLQALVRKDEEGFMNCLALLAMEEGVEAPIGEILQSLVNLIATDEDLAFQALYNLAFLGFPVFEKFLQGKYSLQVLS